MSAFRTFFDRMVLAQMASNTKTKIRPEQRVGERDNLDRHWRSLFLDTLAETSNVTASAQMAGVNPSHAYKVRRNEPEFRDAWFAALLEGYEHLEMETLQRLRFGNEKDDPKFDIANAIRILTLHRETVARQRALQNEEDEESVLASLNAKLDLMRQREAATKDLLAESGATAIAPDDGN